MIFFLFQASRNLLSVLDKMDTWIGEIPPIEQPQRFGNKAFRDWFKRLEEVEYRNKLGPTASQTKHSVTNNSNNSDDILNLVLL